MKRWLVVWVLAVGALTACGAAGVDVNPSLKSVLERSSTATRVQHVVIVIQENRSFDNLFATFPGADGTTRGALHGGQQIALTKSNLLDRQDLLHGRAAWVMDYDGGKMDGFDLPPGADGVPLGRRPYQYVDPAQIAPYWALAKRYVLADRAYQTQGSDSFTAHQDLIAGGTAITPKYSIVNSPTSNVWGCDAAPGTVTSLITASDDVLWNAGPFPCFRYATLRDLLDRKRISWRYYTPLPRGGWDAFEAIASVRKGPQWHANISTPQTNILMDANAGNLAAVSWVVPDAEASDHPGVPRDLGPAWVGNVVNAIGQSAAWKSTVIIVVWDDWGGFYDHVAPPQFGFGSLGFRVPMLIISPYARTGYVSHTQYEFGSILKFVEDIWGLGRLGTSDSRANSISDAFDFSQAPHKYVAVKVDYSRRYFLRLPPSNLPVDNY